MFGRGSKLGRGVRFSQRWIVGVWKSGGQGGESIRDASRFVSRLDKNDEGRVGGEQRTGDIFSQRGQSSLQFVQQRSGRCAS